MTAHPSFVHDDDTGQMMVGVAVAPTHETRLLGLIEAVQKLTPEASADDVTDLIFERGIDMLCREYGLL
jgi:hypothetical protein